MDKTSIYKLLRVVTTAYARHYTKFTNDDFEDLSNAWEFVLSDYTYEQASVGLKLYMQNDNGFPPSPGQVIEWIRKSDTSTHSKYPTPQEAWEFLFENYICSSGSIERAQKNFEDLPAILKKCVGGAEALLNMATMDLNTLNSVEKSHFIKTYALLITSHKEQSKHNINNARLDQNNSIGIEG